MLPILSMLVIIVFTIITNRLLRQRFTNQHVAKCYIMCISMTMSTTVGINIAIWISDMVLSAIIAITISFLLAWILSNGLPIYLFIESMSACFMGAMMGAMLTLMTTQYLNLSIIFFTTIFVVSTVMIIGLWNREMFPVFIKAIPKYVLISAGLTVCVLGLSGIMTQNEMPEVENHHH